ncbi:MAG TPA: helix-turn-helix domain-containing protein, partial [Pararhizobium sp.]|uniref:helix-turn-helix domain-containing protein n=1 Tax=Pararhizobium sp. TaxID=1977563 RepID=UPI002B6C3D2C
GSSAADMAAFIVRRHISKEAERNALEVLQIEKARTALAIQTRKPLSIECKDPRIRAVLIIMEQHVESTLPIEELASSVGLSRRQMERLFMNETKSSPALVYRRVRMERAKQLLTRTKAPLIEVALEVGFENASHFSRAFSQAFGQSPTKLRAALAAIED